MNFIDDYMRQLNNCENVTVLKGSGEFQEYTTGDKYEIESIKFPFTANGKHITVFNREEGLEDTVMDFSYLDGKILSFKGSGLEHW